MKLYGEFTKKDWLEVLDVRESKIPHSFIIHGEWNHDINIKMWSDTLKKEIWLPKWNTIVGKYNGMNIGYANVFGGPMAATIVHQFGLAGTSQFIQTGYVGGLSKNIEYGDILIVTEAAMKDGVSQFYLPDHQRVKADNQLVDEAINYCEEKGYRYSTGSIMSTSAMLLETAEQIKCWSACGFLGVDMETATTLAIAKKFNKKAIALMNMSDHLVKGETLYNYTTKREEIEAETDKKIRKLALHLAQKSF